MPRPTPAMECPQCKHSIAAGSARCNHCQAFLAGEHETQDLGTEAGWTQAPANASRLPFSTVAPGDVINDRYEILALLGQGGMGAVYRARDREVDRLIALKVIRPDLAGQAPLLARFKQELILARQVTHKNVIRIFDLGAAGPLRFITMEYLEGRDLSTLLRERKPSIAETISIVRQICRALEAAHSESVVHRDLKPQNVMINDQGKVSVMDFGLAFSEGASGLTQTGMLLGTPAYMSPEQAQGRQLDGRSDLYALGIIFYEMVTGDVPFRAESMIASLMQRTQGLPVAPIALDRSIPKSVSDVVLKCLAVNPADRYQTAAEMLRDLDVLAGDAPPTTVIAPAPPARTGRKVVAASLAGVLVLAGVGGFVFRDRFARPRTQPKNVTVLVADFENQTGDPVFDNALESMFNIALEGASFVNAYNRGQARRVSAQLRPGATRLDESLARLVALREGVAVVVAGSISKRGSGYGIQVKAVDPASGKTIATRDTTARTREAVLSAIPALAAPVRKRLGDATPESAQLAAGGTFAAASLDAVHAYGVGMEAQFAGKMEDALRSFQQAAQLDPNFARAYSGMAAVLGNLGRVDDAQRDIQLAMQNVARMTDRERLRTRGLYYAQTGDLRKCVEEYGELVRQYPADNIGHNNLANCLSGLRQTGRAVEEAKLAVQIAPRSAAARNNLSLFSSYNGAFADGEREALAARELNPAYAKAYIGLAFAQLGQERPDAAAQAYRELNKLSPSRSAAGLADIALYQGRFVDAAKLLQDAAATDVAANHPHDAAVKLAELAYTLQISGRSRPAVESAAAALAKHQGVEIQYLAGRVFAGAGDPRARQIATALEAEVQPERQAYGKLIEGAIEIRSGRSQQAIRLLEEANHLLDSWIGHFELGRAYLSAGLYAQADGEFDRCLKRRGEALSLFADESPTFGYFPPVYYYQGLAREGLKSPEFAGSYQAYLNIRGAAGEDPLLAEVRRRAGK